MIQPAFNFTERPLPANPYTEGTGNYRVYEFLLRNRRVSLYELHHELKVDTARIRDIRHLLRKYGFDYEVIRIRESLTEYRIIDRE